MRSSLIWAAAAREDHGSIGEIGGFGNGVRDEDDGHTARLPQGAKLVVEVESA